eukprot:11995441-Alexandrium_andersonii.AAC.1
MPSPQPAKRGSRSPSRRRGRTDARAELPPVPPPPARRNARSPAGKPAPADEETEDRHGGGLRRSRKPPRDRPGKREAREARERDEDGGAGQSSGGKRPAKGSGEGKGCWKNSKQ